MNLKDKQTAIEILAEKMFDSITDLENSRPFVEDRWSFIGNVRPIIEEIYGDNVQFQQRTQALTDREVLQQAADQLAASDLTDGERDAYLIVWHYLTPLKSRTKAEQNWYKNSIFLQHITRSLQLL